jgi:FkbM family methyltransferase
MSLLTKMVGSLPDSWITSVARLQWRHAYLKSAVNFAANRFRNSDGVIQTGEGRGLKFNAGGANAGYLLGTSEPSMQAAMAALIRPKMTVFDIGANVGFFSMIAARLVGPKGRVVSFEPLPINSNQCEYNAALNAFEHVLVRTEALGNENGSANFFTSDTPTLGRFEKFGSPDESHARTIVPVRRLDSVLQEKNLPKPSFIKMDVEGAEVDVLEGASQTLAENRPLLLVELHGTNEPVAVALEKQDYVIRVLGSTKDIRAARWNAHVIATPRERDDLNEAVISLTASALAE